MTDCSKGVGILKISLMKKLRAAVELRYSKTSEFQCCEKSLAAWLKGEDKELKKKRTGLIRFLYFTYHDLLKYDKSAVLDIIHECIIRASKYPVEKRSVALMRRISTNKDLMRPIARRKQFISNDEVANMLAEGLYVIVKENSSYDVDTYAEFIKKKYALTGHSTDIVEAALAVCNTSLKGKTFQEKMNDFLKKFKEEVGKRGIEETNLRSALYQLRKKLAEENPFEKLLPTQEDYHNYQFPSEGQMMGFMIHSKVPEPQHTPPTSDKGMEILEVLFSRFSHWMERLEEAEKAGE